MKILNITASGSVNGQTFSRNRFGQYVRRHAVPVQPRSPSQKRVRSAFSGFTKSWQLLTQSQQESWNTAAKSRTRVDKLGQTIRLTGHQYFISVNQIAQNLGAPLFQIPPTVIDVIMPTLDVINDANDNTFVSIEMNAPSDLAANGTYYFQLQASRPQSPGRAFAHDYRDIIKGKVLPGSTVASFSMPQLNQVWGELPNAFSFQSRGRIYSSGIVSSWVSVRVVQDTVGGS